MSGIAAFESQGSLPPMPPPPPPSGDYFRTGPAEVRRADLEGLRDKIYGIKPEKPPERGKLSPPLQRTQEDESVPKHKVVSQKGSVSVSVSGLPLPTKVPGKVRETQEPAVGKRVSHALAKSIIQS
ncbi:unnamed protein product [Cylicostephanus goldi]|uniref:Uncharacterized protein n=1 Tax=Cylicostephanus goldi TaxID=71465 RepID=A0A3P6UCI6_CYLGO|nr:unnamed protein product [Cylicostephanus goldi]